MQKFHVYLHIQASELQRYYSGEVSSVVAKSIEGKTIQFPAARLRPFILHTGIQGMFELTVDSDNRLQDLRKLD
ncbi:MAG: DUF2835 domain-containing protein [Pseudomonadales bacterium]|nr:DUF2835 domain-containing protein [Pseudomonadales bacterium]